PDPPLFPYTTLFRSGDSFDVVTGQLYKEVVELFGFDGDTAPLQPLGAVVHSRLTRFLNTSPINRSFTQAFAKNTLNEDEPGQDRSEERRVGKEWISR